MQSHWRLDVGMFVSVIQGLLPQIHHIAVLHSALDVEHAENPTLRTPQNLCLCLKVPNFDDILQISAQLYPIVIQTKQNK